MNSTRYWIGMDVGSTTVKAVVVDGHTDEIVWRDYHRHETKQPEKVLEFLRRFDDEVPNFRTECEAGDVRVFITGSGGSGIAKQIGAKFVQEVNAVCLAIEKLHPEAGSVIELGGQDAKIIVFKEDPETGRKKKIPSMNDKCAGGTGAVIDKINAKLRIPADELCEQGYDGVKIHKVAGKCGVFAETDINSLQKQGVPTDQLMASLFDAIIGQNLSVLTRGHTLRPHVILLGGPNTYIRGMREAWQHHIPITWAEREHPIPDGVDPKSLIMVPENAQYFAALGACEFGKDEDEGVGTYRGFAGLEYYVTEGRKETRKGASEALSKSAEQLEEFRKAYDPEPFEPAKFSSGDVVRGFIGLDGGSTSTKAVLLSTEREVLAKAYQLSGGNPIEDTIEVIGELRNQVESQGATMHVLGVGTTGYAKDVLKDVLGADAAIVETVAHAESALHFYDGVDVICDVGGQDIKIMVLNDGSVKDFKLNTQCSAGNGYFLQSTAGEFGVPVEEFADMAFTAEAMPTFGYGCAVFMQSDIVDFQRQGWSPAEIMAGLAAVLPKNIWLYVAQIPNLSKLGTKFVLQGGTQRNLAAVKSQVDFIESRFRGKEEKPELIVHKHCGESGAIGAGLEAARLWENGRRTTYIGLDATETISYTATTSEDTRCYFCKNECLRTFIDVEAVSRNGSEQGDVDTRIAAVGGSKSKVSLAPGARRLIVNNSCEKGLVEDVEAMREIKKGLDARLKAAPNIVEKGAREVFKSFKPERVADEPPRITLTPAHKRRVERMANREKFRVGIPRLLNQYSNNPLFSAYFESLGVRPQNLVYSDYTTEDLYKEGAKRGAIDPCFPSKLGIPHVHNLLFKKHEKKPLDVIFFPMIDDLKSDLVGTVDCRACPTVTATPEAVKAAFIKEGDVFAKKGIEYLNPLVNIARPSLFARQMYNAFGDFLGLSKRENQRAVNAGYEALQRFQRNMRDASREAIDELERECKLGIVVLGRPYHNDPGINHEILVEFQKLGYPVFTQDSLPIDEDILERLFGEEIRAGEIASGMDIRDVWGNAYSENTSLKVWGAKYTARHPNLVALEFSNFKCGHDAPIYSVVEEIIECSGTPYFSFKDLDENRPAGSIKIRVETISYFLKRYREDMMRSAGIVPSSAVRGELVDLSSPRPDTAPENTPIGPPQSADLDTHRAEACADTPSADLHVKIPYGYLLFMLLYGKARLTGRVSNGGTIMAHMPAPSAQYEVTMRLEYPHAPGWIAKIAGVIAENGGAIGAMDIVRIKRGRTVRDYSVDSGSFEQAHRIVDAVKEIPDVALHFVSDNTFLMHLGGKMEIRSKVPLKTRADLSMAYTPGVARVCRAIHETPDSSFNLTIRKNTVAIVSDGSAVLGLGNIGAAAAMPVMEGKAILFKEFGGVDAFPLCIDRQDPEAVIDFCRMITPTFGGINLEDIKAPNCFYIEDTLRRELDIPVFHDDQHGTAIVMLAGLINALKIIDRKPAGLKVVIAGAGAAGVACTRTLAAYGFDNIVVCDSRGAIHRGRDTGGAPSKQWIAENTNPAGEEGALKDVIAGANIFIGVSQPGILDRSDVEKMGADRIVFAMSNPDPEVSPEEVEDIVRVMATGRSDYPNQINNVLAFPGIFRGALDVRASDINDEMKIAAALAIAGSISDEERQPDYIIPSAFNREVMKSVAAAVAEAARGSGVSRRTPEVKNVID